MGLNPHLQNRRLLKASDVSEILGYHPTYVYKLACDGRIESIKMGRSRRFTEEDVEEYIDRLREGNSGKKGD